MCKIGVSSLDHSTVTSTKKVVFKNLWLCVFMVTFFSTILKTKKTVLAIAVDYVDS